jgi:hypothetical protein
LLAGPRWSIEHYTQTEHDQSRQQTAKHCEQNVLNKEIEREARVLVEWCQCVHNQRRDGRERGSEKHARASGTQAMTEESDWDQQWHRHNRTSEWRSWKKGCPVWHVHDLTEREQVEPGHHCGA